jgi:hypothetical protein
VKIAVSSSLPPTNRILCCSSKPHPQLLIQLQGQYPQSGHPVRSAAYVGACVEDTSQNSRISEKDAKKALTHSLYPNAPFDRDLDPDGLRRALARVHRHHAGVIQARRKRTGHFWQGRFGAAALDEEYLAAALRYVSLNPVRARWAERAQDWRWASTRAHLRGKDDGITALAPIKDRFADFADLLASEPEADLFGKVTSHVRELMQKMRDGIPAY